MVIILMTIGGGYSIGVYWCLLMVIILMAIILMVIEGYYINGYWWLLVAILSMAIGDYFVTIHWLLFY
jgi:hypothetical protein